MSAKPKIETTDEARQPTTPDERKAAKKARKDHRARVRLVIETYEWLLNCYSRPPRLTDKCQKLADEMMAKARESPEDFGRWKSVVVQVSNPQEGRDHGRQ